MEGRSRTRWIVIACTVVILVVGAATLAVALNRDESEVPSVALGPPRDGIIDVPGFPPRWSPASTSVDGALFVFGGSIPRTQEFRNDGVLVAPDFSSVTPLPSAPFDPPLYSPSAVGVDGQIVVAGISCRVEDRGDTDSAEPSCTPGTNAAGVLDARDGRMQWRLVAIPNPLRQIRMGGSHALGATSDGRAIFQFGPFQHETIWSFDPRRDEWHEVEGPDVRNDASCMNGDILIVQSSSYRNNGAILPDDPMRHVGPGGGGGAGYLGDGFVLPTIASRDLTSTAPWTVSAPAADVVFISGGPRLTCTDAGAFINDGASVSVSLLYSLESKSWTDPPPPPSRAYFGRPVWTGTDLVFIAPSFGGPSAGMAYNPSSDAWRMLAGLPEMERGGLWNGDAIVGYQDARGANAEPGTAGVYRYVVPAG